VIGPGRQFGIALARMLLRPIGVAAFAAGLAGALAAAAAWTSGPTDFTPSLGTVSSAVMKVAAVFFAASLVSAALMPSTKTLIADEPGDTTPPPMFVVYVVGLMAIAAIAAGPLRAWWNENAEQATRLTRCSRRWRGERSPRAYSDRA
jgi:hypothetical protein